MPPETVAEPVSPTPTTPTPTPVEATVETTTTTGSATTPSLLNEPTPPPVAPSEYSAWNLPQGWELQEDAGKEINSMFKEMSLTQENGQRLIDSFIKYTNESQSRPYQVYQDMRQNWRNEIANDPQLGGKLNQVKQTVSRAIDTLGNAKLIQEFKESLDFTGVGDNPGFIRAFYAFAQRLTESTHVVGNGPAPTGQNRTGSGAHPGVARAMYPDLPSSS